MKGTPAGERLLWLLAVLLFSVIVGQMVFILKTRMGVRTPEALLAAGSAFAGAAVMALAFVAVAVGS